ncbi:biotrophy-associated secreted protein 2 [Colletotrichum acutatum]|uniref:Biotrophy-associated secreted protein 2 n=1 Tax=Glomerella acutata TaxID=27357 RepID=A0AAD8UJE0_GLOAC|nr:biotrophy-associated secreted protein 2 [Colletotrichum acutatum]KAK1722825.1 biotrophy-associated secreted protein 2 [Colletotrichum acutatum]
MVRITLFATLAFAMTALAITPNNAGAKNVGQGNGAQFITGGCVDDADCSSACCADASGVGVCSAEATQFQNGKNGCNFVDPNKAATIAAAKAQVAKQGF